MTDVFTAATWTSQRARATCNRDRTAPVVMPREMVGHLPDPRAFDARTVRAGFVLRTIVQFAVCVLAVVALWALFWRAG